jgi:inosine/xanthosine triphosphatase
MKRILVASTSAIKIRAVENAFKKFESDFKIEGKKSESGVASQPFGLKEIVNGVTNRINYILQNEKYFDFVVGLENGIIFIEEDKKYIELAGIKVFDKATGLYHLSFSAAHETSNWVIDRIKNENTEHGFIIQELSGGGDKDPISYYSRNLISREKLLVDAVELALIKIYNKDRFLKI